MIPKELRALRQWTYSYSEEEMKRPTHSQYKPNGALSYEQARMAANGKRYTGVYVTRFDPYLLGDIDDLRDPSNPFDELPIGVADLLRRGTYSEISPSGKGLRFLLRLPSGENKDALDGSYFHLRDAPEGKARKIQINAGQPWMTITGNTTPFSVDRIAEITIDELDLVFNIKKECVLAEVIPLKPVRLPEWNEVRQRFMSLPLDQNPRVKRAYKKTFGHEYQHYEYWLKCLMALSDYATQANQIPAALETAIIWSRKDPAAYKSDDDVIDRWQSMRKMVHQVTYKTIYGLSNLSYFDWPHVSKATQRTESRPILTSYRNYQYALNYYDICIYRDAADPSTLYLTMDEDIVDLLFQTPGRLTLGKYYGPFEARDTIPIFHMAFQKLGLLSCTPQHIQMAMTNRLSESTHEVDLVREYFDTPYADLPPDLKPNEEYKDRSTFDDLFDCIDIHFQTDDVGQEEALYRAYYKKWLFGLVRYMYMPNPHKFTNNCVLVLTGPEQTRKTSHFQYLLPHHMRASAVVATTHGFRNGGAVRDVTKIASTARILVWDELEQYLDADTESNFKKLIDNTPQKFIDKYNKRASLFKPRAIYGATSNLRRFKLGSEGSRRLFHIPIRWVDTDRMDLICWHTLMNELRTDFFAELRNSTTPWLLTKAEIDYQRTLHGNLMAQNSLDLILEEIYDFETPFETYGGCIPGVKSLQTDKTGRFATIGDVQTMISKLGYQLHGINHAFFKATLERKCGLYTRTTSRSQALTKPRGTIERGEMRQGNNRRWVMPPVREDVSAKMYNQFKEVI